MQTADINGAVYNTCLNIFAQFAKYSPCSVVKWFLVCLFGHRTVVVQFNWKIGLSSYSVWPELSYEISYKLVCKAKPTKFQNFHLMAQSLNECWKGVVNLWFKQGNNHKVFKPSSNIPILPHFYLGLNLWRSTFLFSPCMAKSHSSIRRSLLIFCSSLCTVVKFQMFHWDVMKIG